MTAGSQVGFCSFFRVWFWEWHIRKQICVVGKWKDKLKYNLKFSSLYWLMPLIEFCILLSDWQIVTKLLASLSLQLPRSPGLSPRLPLDSPHLLLPCLLFLSESLDSSQELNGTISLVTPTLLSVQRANGATT